MLLKFGNLTLDPIARTVFVSGIQTPNKGTTKITSGEKDLLFFLASNSGKIFSQEALLTACYTGTKPGPKIIDVFVCKIRKKLKRISPQEETFIETVHSVGYMLPKAVIIETKTKAKAAKKKAA